MMLSFKWQPKMLELLLSILIFWVYMEGAVAFSNENQIAGHEIKLKFGTPVLLRFVKKITSENFRVGEVVELEVSANVYKDGFVVIPEGSPAKGVMISGSRKYYAGEGGNLVIGNFYLILNNSQRINLDGIMRLEGEDSKKSLFLGQCCFLGYLIKGSEACIEKGKTFRTVLSRDQIIRQVKQP